MRLLSLVLCVACGPAARAFQIMLPKDVDPAPAASAPAAAPPVRTPAPRPPPDAPERDRPARPGSARTEAGLVECKTCGPNASLKKQAGRVREATSRCDMARVTALARRIGAGTSSGGLCLPAVRRAFQEAGCAVPAGFAMNAVHAFRELQKVWRCQGGGTAAQAPDGAVLFSVGCGSHHTDCLASSEYVGCPYRQIGWCKP